MTEINANERETRQSEISREEQKKGGVSAELETEGVREVEAQGGGIKMALASALQTTKRKDEVEAKENTNKFRYGGYALTPPRQKKAGKLVPLNYADEILAQILLNPATREVPVLIITGDGREILTTLHTHTPQKNRVVVGKNANNPEYEIGPTDTIWFDDSTIRTLSVNRRSARNVS